MKNENLIYVKFEHDEAIQSKKDILSSEMGLIKIVKIMKRYHLLRMEELKLKLKLYRRLKEINKDVKKLQATLPRVEIPKILKKEGEEEPKKVEKPQKVQVYEDSLEVQLQEIQNKLKSLQG